jgi:hypothetical protein
MIHMDILSILGQHLESDLVKQLLRLVGTECAIQRYDGFYYYSFPKSGFSLMFDAPDDTVCSIFMYREGFQDYGEFKGELPHSLAFSSSRNDVHRVLGPPDKSGGDAFNADLKRIIEPWDAFDCEVHRLNVTYDARNDIVLVSICKP